MQHIELSPESIEAIARRVAELVVAERSETRRTLEPVPLLPIAAPRSPERKVRGRRRDDLAKGLEGTPFR